MQRLTQLAFVVWWLSAVASSWAQPIVVYDAEGFENFSLGSIHGQAAGVWHPGVPQSPTSPMYRHWEVKSGNPADAQIVTVPNTAWGKVLKLSGDGALSTWLQLGWEGADSAGFLYWDYPQVTTVEFLFLASNRSFTAETLRNSQDVGQVVLGVEFDRPPSHSGLSEFRTQLRKGASTEPITDRYHGALPGWGWTHVRCITYHPRPWHTQGSPGPYGFVRIFLNGTEVTGPNVFPSFDVAPEAWYTWWPVWPGYVGALRLVLPEHQSSIGGGHVYINDFRVTWDRYSPEPHINSMSFFDYRPAEFMPGGTSNWAHVGTVEDLNDLSEGGVRGITQFITLKDVFFAPFLVNGQWQGYRLRPDYTQCWRAAKELLQPYITHGHVKGLFLGDEVLWSGVSFEDMQMVANLIRSEYPSLPIMLSEATKLFVTQQSRFNQSIFAGTPPTNWSLPQSIDLLATAWYGSSPTDFFLPEWHEQYVFPRLQHQNQRLILIPEAFGQTEDDPENILYNDPPITLLEWEQRALEMADLYYFWANRDTRIAGFMPWHWDILRNDTDLEYTWYGARDLPALGWQWQTIGNMIVSSQTVPLPITRRVPTQTFNTFSNGEALPSTFAFDALSGNGLPLPPPVANVHFFRPAGNTHIRMLNTGAGAAFRYSWGTTNPGFPHLMWHGSSQQYLFFDIFVDPLQPFKLRVTPARYSKRPVEIELDTSQASHLRFGVETNSGWQYTTWTGATLVPGWNQCAAFVNLGDLFDKNDNTIRLFANGAWSQVYPLPGWIGVQDEHDVVFTTIGFQLLTSGEVLIDNIRHRNNSY